MSDQSLVVNESSEQPIEEQEVLSSSDSLREYLEFCLPSPLSYRHVLLTKKHDSVNQFLNTPCMDVNMRLYYTNKFYRNTIWAIAEYLKWVIEQKYEENNKGIKGISAIKVGYPFKIISVKMATGIEILINPIITHNSLDRTVVNSQCSLLGSETYKVLRFSKIGVSYYNIDGVYRQISQIDGTTCYCLQHEIDHCNGKTLVDHIAKNVYQ